MQKNILCFGINMEILEKLIIAMDKHEYKNVIDQNQFLSKLDKNLYEKIFKRDVDNVDILSFMIYSNFYLFYDDNTTLLLN